MGNLPVEDALEHPQQIAGAPDHAGGREDSVDRPVLECAAQNQKLADKSVEQGQSNRSQHNKKIGGGIDGHGSCEAAEFADLVGVTALVENSSQHEQAA